MAPTKRKRLVLLGVLSATAALVVGLSLRTRQPPIVPRDPDHAAIGGNAGCAACHALDGAVPRGPKHPPGEDCLRCHGLP
jgi:hypothetical protein